MGKLYPICRETAFRLLRFLPTSGSLPSVWELLQEEAYTLDDEGGRSGGSAPRRGRTGGRGGKAAQARGGDNGHGRGQHQQMRYYVGPCRRHAVLLAPGASGRQ